MLIIKVSDDKNSTNVHIEASGDLLGMVAELGSAVNKMYVQFAQQSEDAAEMFRLAVIHTFAHLDSPVWEKQGEDGEGFAACMVKEVKKHD